MNKLLWNFLKSSRRIGSRNLREIVDRFPVQAIIFQIYCGISKGFPGETADEISEGRSTKFLGESLEYPSRTAGCSNRLLLKEFWTYFLGMCFGDFFERWLRVSTEEFFLCNLWEKARNNFWVDPLETLDRYYWIISYMNFSGIFLGAIQGKFQCSSKKPRWNISKWFLDNIYSKEYWFP